MQYSSFINYIRSSFEEIMGPDTPVRIQTVLKNNSVHLDALTILPEGENLSPSIYLNEYYEQYREGKPLPSIVSEINSIYRANCEGFSIDTDMILNFHCAKHRIGFKLINFQKNTELLSTIPHIPYMDMAIVFYILLESDLYGDATALISNEHMNLWKTDVNTLYSYAEMNTRRMLGVHILPLEELMRSIIIEDLKQDALSYQKEFGLEDMLSQETLDLMTDDILNQYLDENGKPGLYVITNKSRYNGAASILYKDALEKAACAMKGNYYILPSSVHEVILFPDYEMPDPSTLLNMVHEVNSEEVAITDQLSDNIYYYDATSKKVHMISA